MNGQQTYTAFIGHQLIVSGALSTVLPVLKDLFERNDGALPLVFEDESGRQVDFDLRGTLNEVLARALPAPARPGPGRPKLGVVSREVTLLPRHWDWLEQQPNGASAALRRLVEQARKHEPGKQRMRQAIDATGRFMSAIAGNLPGYEEATRALYAGARPRLEGLIADWPPDVRAHIQGLVQNAFANQDTQVL
jgi:uncharacterized protein